ncbi:hypothetical protein Leryth_022815 [Lithospermum erythrorhizon]|nr:hypothetical protein Leryth_022815 [Lithospermum erythrorhizon]
MLRSNIVTQPCITRKELKEPEASVDSPPELPVAQSNEENQKPEELTQEKRDVAAINYEGELKVPQLLSF